MSFNARPYSIHLKCFYFPRLQDARLEVLKKILQQREEKNNDLNTKRLDKVWWVISFILLCNPFTADKNWAKIIACFIKFKVMRLWPGSVHFQAKTFVHFRQLLLFSMSALGKFTVVSVAFNSNYLYNCYYNRKQAITEYHRIVR